ncbi:MAG: DUF5050 domain-containing protein [Lachnospiraceae bacterium]|nr:DUF5050 domain-containing protein [Lachnospiraceae bacterium]
MNRVKRCIGLGILLLFTGCSAGVSTESESSPQGELQLEDELQIEAESQSGQESRQEEIPVQTAKEENNLTAELYSEDEDFYVQCLQNLKQGNSITYADGYYYFRSQTENYSLCRTKGTGMPVEVVADQIPGSIYVRDDQVYFINVSDNRTLYCVGTDGRGLKKISDFPMQELIVLEDKVYFRSVYDREYDPFYLLTEEPAEDDCYIYSMNLDGSGCELLVSKVCMEFVTDGEWLYYLVYEDEYVLYKNSMDGKEEEKILHKKDGIWDILPYQGDLYLAEGKQNLLVRLNAQGKEEILAFGVLHFTITRGQAYVMNEKKILKVDLATGEDRILAEKKKTSGNGYQSREDTYPWYSGSHNRGIFLVNGQVFARYYESETKGVLWHILDEEEFVVFEDMEPLTAEELVLDTSLLHEADIYYPGRIDENAEKYLDADGDLYYEESFGTGEAGSVYGYFSITLPKFNSKLDSYEQMNQQMEKLLELALDDKDSFFQEMSELRQDQWISWRREHEYCNLYIGEKYISMHYSRGGYEGGMREWKQSMPLIFDRETGLMLHMDDLFTVEESIYMKRLTGAIYKYCEMMGMDYWNDAFDNNVLVKNFGDLRCYLTPDGIVLCYERYEIKHGASGSPAFEIPYEWFADIFKQ